MGKKKKKQEIILILQLVYNQQYNRVFENWLLCIISGYYPPPKKIWIMRGITLTMIDNRRVFNLISNKIPTVYF